MTHNMSLPNVAGLHLCKCCPARRRVKVFFLDHMKGDKVCLCCCNVRSWLNMQAAPDKLAPRKSLLTNHDVVCFDRGVQCRRC